MIQEKVIEIFKFSQVPLLGSSFFQTTPPPLLPTTSSHHSKSGLFSVSSLRSQTSPLPPALSGVDLISLTFSAALTWRSLCALITGISCAGLSSAEVGQSPTACLPPASARTAAPRSLAPRPRSCPPLFPADVALWLPPSQSPLLGPHPSAKAPRASQKRQ